MRIELSPTVSHDRRSLGFPGVAQFLSEQPPHHILEDIRKFFGPDIRRKLSQKPGQEQSPQTEGQSISKWRATCIVKWHGTQ